MALEKSGNILRDAYKNGYGVPAFNVLNYEMINIAIQKAEELQKPILIACYPGFGDMISIEAVAEITRMCAKNIKVPVGIHLDHSVDYAEIIQAMHMGYSSVMYDGSALPFEENIKNTAEVVKVAKALGVDVEAELGQVGNAANVSDFADSSKFTSPKDAAEFVKRTGCSSLAVAVGNAHGSYAQEPNLDLNLIGEISKTINTPLVLHGGSGIPDSQVKEAVKRGIAKMNVGTEYFHTYFGAAESKVMSKRSTNDMISGAAEIKSEVFDYLTDKINLVYAK